MKKNILPTILSVWILLISTGGVFAEAPQEEENRVGAVYTMTNALEGNEVVIFSRNEEGLLTRAGSVSTGGTGSGGRLDPLASQQSLALSHDKRWLLAVNAGSNEISVFRVLPDGLELVDKVYSGGVFPVSVTVYHNLVYVLNAGASPNIIGFNLGPRGRLTPLAGAARSLPPTGAFAQVGFDPKGETLVVTDKANSQILVYSVDDDGLPALNPVASISNGRTPFGFIFDRQGRLLVVEVGANAVSSYEILQNGALQVISGSVPNGQRAACWIAGNQRGEIFTANPGSHTLSAYRLMARQGELTLLNGAAGAANSPLDLATTENGRFLYALDPNSGGIGMFRIERDGGLTNLGIADGELLIFAQGLAAR